MATIGLLPVRGVKRFWDWLLPGIAFEKPEPLSRGDFLDILKTFFAALTFASVMIAGMSFYLQQRAISKEYEWRHKKEAQDILKAWDDRTSTQKASIESYFRRRY